MTVLHTVQTRMQQPQTMRVVRLGPEYLDQAVALRQGNVRDIDGQAFMSPTYARHYLKNEYLVPDNNMYRAYGVVDADNRLWCYSLQKLLTSQRAWILVLIVSDQNHVNGLPMNGVGLLFDQMISYAESLRYYRYWTVTPDHRAVTHDKVWARVSKMKGSRYVSAIEEVIPPRSVSAFGFYWDDVLSTVMFDETLVIRHMFLKPEFRTTKD